MIVYLEKETLKSFKTMYRKLRLFQDRNGSFVKMARVLQFFANYTNGFTIF